MDEYEQIWSANGRITRSLYWTRWALASSLIFLTQLLFSHSPNGITVLLLFVVSVPMTVFTIIQGVKRMHDVNKNGWYILIPIYNLVLACKDGVPMRNKYGPDPKERSENILCYTCDASNDSSAEVCANCKSSLTSPDKSEPNIVRTDTLLVIIVSFFAFRAVVSFLIETYVENWFISSVKYVYIMLNLIGGLVPVFLALLISKPKLRIVVVFLALVAVLYSIISNVKWLLQ